MEELTVLLEAKLQTFQDVAKLLSTSVKDITGNTHNFKA